MRKYRMLFLIVAGLLFLTACSKNTSRIDIYIDEVFFGTVNDLEKVKISSREGHYLDGWYSDNTYQNNINDDIYNSKVTKIYGRHIKMHEISFFSQDKKLKTQNVKNLDCILLKQELLLYDWYLDKDFIEFSNVEGINFDKDYSFFGKPKNVIMNVIKNEKTAISYDKESYTTEDSITMIFSVELGYEIDYIRINENRYEVQDGSVYIEKLNQNKLFIEIEVRPMDNLPVIKVDTKGILIENKETYIDSDITMTNTRVNDFIDKKAGIRLRGNYTSTLAKKPYRIKFDEKIGLMGNPSNKSWVLLADYTDETKLRNYFAYSLAQKLNNGVFAPSTQHVHLYINEEYQGIYLLTDQIQENYGRVSIEEEISLNSEIPFLIEVDARAPQEGIENKDYFVVDGFNYVIKYPDYEERKTQEQFEYVKRYIEKLDFAIKNNLDFEEYIDIKTLMDYYLLQELMGQMDLEFSSIYMYKEKNGKLKMGPVWDFDISSGNIEGTHKFFVTGWKSKNNWFAYLLNNDVFKERILIRWNEIITIIDEHIEKVKDYSKNIENTVSNDLKIWGVKAKYQEEVDFFFSYLSTRKFWMHLELNDLN